MESAANRLRMYESSLIPGLLQTREYAEVVLSREPALAGDELHQAVAVRMERQQLLARRRPRAPILDVILDEGVLRRTIADVDGMQRQLAYLANISQKPGVSVRILPAGIGPHRASAAGSFVILDFPALGTAPPEPTTIYSENLTGALYLEKPGEVHTYTDVWQSLDDIALDRRASDDLIATIIKESDE
jgi:hypothetical protein